MRARLAFVSVFVLSSALFAQDRRIQPIVARKQVALVIGNAAYSNGPLTNSVRDAEAMAAKLRQLGYDVSLITDAGRKTMGQALDQFVEQARDRETSDFSIIRVMAYKWRGRTTSYLPISRAKTRLMFAMTRIL